jgi:hypothetical protein
VIKNNFSYNITQNRREQLEHLCVLLLEPHNYSVLYIGDIEAYGYCEDKETIKLLKIYRKNEKYFLKISYLIKTSISAKRNCDS